jgi:glyoxylase-like metal-dependent hydrolase (beta-lactamase superfamily II)
MSVQEIIDWHDVRGIRVGRFGGRVNTTCIVWRLGTTLIDTGPPNQWSFVRAFAAERALSRVIVSHHHEDHAGNLGRFAAATDLPLLAPPESHEPLAHGFPLQLYRRVVWGRPRRVAPQVLPAELELEDGTVLESILLAGHSPDMTCLLDRRRGLLFAADLYVGKLRYLRRDENLDGIIRSLRRILEYEFDTLLCSHRGIIEPAHEALRDKLDHLVSLRDEARSLAARGLPVGAITKRLLGPEDMISRVSLGHFSKRNLIAQCLAGA